MHAPSIRRTAPARCAARRSSKETVSTIGEQRRSNYALQPMSKAAFVELVTADQPDAPAYFTYDAVLNSQERPTLDETLARDEPLTLDARAGAAGGGRAGARHARPGGVRRGAPGRQHQHRPRRPVRDVGRHGAEPRAADRDHRRPRARARSRPCGWAASASITSSDISRTGCTASIAAGADGVDRAAQRAARGRAPGGRGRAGRRSWSTCARRASASRSASPAAWASRSIISPSGCRSCRAIGRCSSTAPAATDRRSPRACCSAHGFAAGQRDRRRHRRVGSGEPADRDVAGAGVPFVARVHGPRRRPTGRAGTPGRGRRAPRRGSPRGPRRPSAR